LVVRKLNEFLIRVSLWGRLVRFSVIVPVFLSQKALATPKLLDFKYCRLGDIVRTLEVLEEDNSFVLIYTKGRDREEAARGTLLTFVRSVMQNIQGNLEGAGWKCETVAPEKVSEKTAGP
jgi:hypothetical protein